MTFHVSKFRYLHWISIIRPKPTLKTKPLFTNSCTSRSCHSTGEALPEEKSKSTISHRANKSLTYFNSQITKHGKAGNVGEAEKIFARIRNKDIVSRTSMLTAYAKNDDIVNARKVFDEMPERNEVSFNAMITAYGNFNGMADEAFELFSSMPERNAVSYGVMISCFVRAKMFDRAEKVYSETPVEFRDPVCSSTLLQGYLKDGNVDDALRIFDGMTVRDVVSRSSMVDGFCKAGRIVEARGLFDEMPKRNVVTWTSMIDGYMKDGSFQEGFDLFLEMRRDRRVEVNSDTLAVMFGGCGSFLKYNEGYQIHGLVPRVGVDFEGFLGNSVLTMYSRFGDMGSATKVFHEMVKRDLVSWGSLIGGYVECGDIKRALEIFETMPKKSTSSWTTLISGLFSQGLTEEAVQLFETTSDKKDSQTWTVLISGLVSNNQYEEAFRWFTELLRQQDIVIEPLACSSVINASASLASINQGTQIHVLVIKNNTDYDFSVQNALVLMYSNCGSFSDAQKIFANIESPSTVSFNSMIHGFAQSGLDTEAQTLFSEMVSVECEPSKTTFTGILSSCVHSRSVEEGLKYFISMKSIHEIEPTLDHYVFAVDLLGQTGLLDEAMELINSMPFEPSSGVWESLLQASRAHSNPGIAKLAAQRRFASELNSAKRLKGIRKLPGSSWIGLRDEVHLFVAGDHSHREIAKIKETLKMIMTEIKQLNSKHVLCFSS